MAASIHEVLIKLRELEAKLDTLTAALRQLGWALLGKEHWEEPPSHHD